MKKLFTIFFLCFLLLLLAGCEGNNIKISSISPATKVSNLPAFTLTVNGTNFTEDSRIVFDGKEMETTFIDETKLSCTIQPEDIPRKASQSISGNLSSTQNNDYTVEVLVRTQSLVKMDSDSVEFTVKADYSFGTPSQFTFDGANSAGRLAIDLNNILHFAYYVSQPYNPATYDTLPVPLYYTSSINNGETWSQKVQINPTDQKCDDAIPFIDSAGAINLFYSSRIPHSNIGGSQYYYTRSMDAGLTWTSPGMLFPKWDNILMLTYALNPDSILFATTYQEPDLSYFTMMRLAFAAYSRGEWRYSGVVDETIHYMYPMGIFNNPNGNITMIYMKENYISESQSFEIALYSAVSSDSGNTWVTTKFYSFTPPSGAYILWLSNIASNKDGKMVMFLGSSPYPAGQLSAENEHIISTNDSLKIIKNGKLEKIRYPSAMAPSMESTSYMISSEDGGATWFNPQTVDFGLSDAAFPYHVQIDDAGNYNLLLLSYVSLNPNPLYALYFCRSLDKGKTWSGITKITEGEFGQIAPEMIISDSEDIYIVITQKTTENGVDYDNYLVKSVD